MRNPLQLYITIKDTNGVEKIKIKEYASLRKYPDIALQNEAIKWIDKNQDELVTRRVKTITIELYLVSPFDELRKDLIESYMLNIKFALAHFLAFGMGD